MQYCKSVYLEIGQKDVIDGLREKYGELKQLYVVVEETGELLSALVNYLSDSSTDNRASLLDEVADCYIVMRHMQCICDCRLTEAEIEGITYKMSSVDTYDITSRRVELKAYSAIGDSIQAFSRVARYLSEDKEVPIEHCIKVREQVKRMYGVACYCCQRASLEHEWVLSRISSKIERMKAWLDKDISFNGTTEYRKVKQAKDDVHEQ